MAAANPDVEIGDSLGREDETSISSRSDSSQKSSQRPQHFRKWWCYGFCAIALVVLTGVGLAVGFTLRSDSKSCQAIADNDITEYESLEQQQCRLEAAIDTPPIFQERANLFLKSTYNLSTLIMPDYTMGFHQTFLSTCQRDRLVQLIQNEDNLDNLSLNTYNLEGMAMSGNGKYVAVVTDDYSGYGVVLVYSLEDGTPVGNPMNFTQPLPSTMMNYESFAREAFDYKTSRINHPNLQPWRIAMNHNGTVVAVGQPDGKHRGSKTGYVRVYRYTKGIWEPSPDIVGWYRYGQLGRHLALDATGNRLIVATTRGNYGYYDARFHNSRSGFWEDKVLVYDFDSPTNNWNLVGTPMEGNDEYISGDLNVNVDTLEVHDVSLSISRNGQRVAFAYSIPEKSTDSDSSLINYRARVYEFVQPPDNERRVDWVLVGKPVQFAEIVDDRHRLLTPETLRVHLSGDGGRLALGMVWIDGTSMLRATEYDPDDANTWTPVGGFAVDLGKNVFDKFDENETPRTLQLAMDEHGQKVVVAHTDASRDYDNGSNVTVYQTLCVPRSQALVKLPESQIPLRKWDDCKAKWQLHDAYYGSLDGRFVNTSTNMLPVMSLGGFLDASSDASTVAALTSADGVRYPYEQFPYYNPDPSSFADPERYKNQLMVWKADSINVIPSPNGEVFKDVAVSSTGTTVVACTSEQLLVYQPESGSSQWKRQHMARADYGGISGVALSGDASVLAISITSLRNYTDSFSIHDSVVLLDTTSLEVLQTIEVADEQGDYLYDWNMNANWKHMELSEDGARLVFNAYSFARNATGDVIDRNNGPFIYSRLATGEWTRVDQDVSSSFTAQTFAQITRSVAMTSDGNRIATVFDVAENGDVTTMSSFAAILDFNNSSWQASALIPIAQHNRYLCGELTGISLSFSASGNRLVASDLCGGRHRHISPKFGGDVRIFEERTRGNWSVVGQNRLAAETDRSSFGARTVLSYDGNTLIVSDPGALNPFGHPTGAILTYKFKPDSCL
jgi:hypothetical protein